MIRGNGLRNTMEPTRRAAGISPEVSKMTELTGGSGWALSREGGKSPPSFFSRKMCDSQPMRRGARALAGSSGIGKEGRRGG